MICGSFLSMVTGASGSARFSSFCSTFFVVTRVIAVVVKAKICRQTLSVIADVRQLLAFAESSFSCPLRVQIVAAWPFLCLLKVAERKCPDFAPAIQTCLPEAA